MVKIRTGCRVRCAEFRVYDSGHHVEAAEEISVAHEPVHADARGVRPRVQRVQGLGRSRVQKRFWSEGLRVLEHRNVAIKVSSHRSRGWGRVQDWLLGVSGYIVAEREAPGWSVRHQCPIP